MDIASLPTGLAVALLAAALLRAAAPILLAALGGLVSDLAGVVNVGLEGLMLVAAFFGAVGSAYAAAWWPTAVWAAPWIGALLGLSASVALAALLALFHLEFGADLIIAGISINLLAGGLTVFLMVSLTGDKGSTASLASFTLPPAQVPGLDGWPLLNALLNGERGAGQHPLVWMACVLPALIGWWLTHCRSGLRLRATGENPDAARAAGIPTKRIQYAALMASGLLAGLGGIYLSMGYLTLFQADMTAGRGYLALAAVFLGARRPLGTLGAALLFGTSTLVAAQLGLAGVPSQLIYMVPPLVTLVATACVHWRQTSLQRRAMALALRSLPPHTTAAARHSGESS